MIKKIFTSIIACFLLLVVATSNTSNSGVFADSIWNSGWKGGTSGSPTDEAANFLYDIRDNRGNSIRRARKGQEVNIIVRSYVNKKLTDFQVTMGTGSAGGVTPLNTQINGVKIKPVGKVKIQGPVNKNVQVTLSAKNENGKRFNLKKNNFKSDGTKAQKQTIYVKVVKNNGSSSNSDPSSSTEPKKSGKDNADDDEDGNEPNPKYVGITKKPSLQITTFKDDPKSKVTIGTPNSARGRVQFTVKFRRPASEKYTRKTIHATVYKGKYDENNRLTNYAPARNLLNPQIIKDGDDNIYIFKGGYKTEKLANATYGFAAYFDPADHQVARPETYSDFYKLKVQNPQSDNLEVCRDYTEKINKIDDGTANRLKDLIALIAKKNERTDKTYRQSDLPTTNPIPDYDRKARNANAYGQQAKNKLAELNKILDTKCTRSTDGTSILGAYLEKLDEVRRNLVTYRDISLDIQAELMLRMPRANGSTSSSDGSSRIPEGFVKYKNPCYSFALPENHTDQKSLYPTYTWHRCEVLEIYEKPSFGLNTKSYVSVYGSRKDAKQTINQFKRNWEGNNYLVVSEDKINIDGQKATKIITKAPEDKSGGRYAYVFVDSPKSYGERVKSFNTQQYLGKEEFSFYYRTQKQVFNTMLTSWRWE